MKAITTVECDAWLKGNIRGDFTLTQIETQYAHGRNYRLPLDTGKKTILARTLVAFLQSKSPGLFWITTTGVWPSSENMELFDGYRRSFGENRSLRVAPGHVFSSSDVIQLECLLDIALYFYWDTVLFEMPAGTVLRTSHDEYISVRAKDRDRLLTIEKTLIDLGIEELVRA